MRAQKSLAQRREERSRALLEESTISQAIYDEAKSQLQVLGAQEDQLEARIRKTEVRAPFDGVVGLRAISEGSYVTPAQSIASLQNLDPIKVDFAVPEKYTGEIGPGDRLEFTVTGSTEVFVGKVYAVEPRIDPQTRTVQVRARAPNTSKRLLPGAFVRVRLVTDTESGALSVPAIALVPSAEGTHVFVVDADQQAEKRIVRTARRTEDRVQITDGLAPGERVIVSGVQQVKAGTRVEVRTVHR
jgi:membrane fusion protein (multidrug efflux system)